MIQEEALGIQKRKPQHSQYVNIAPAIAAGLVAFGVLRFVGMGTGNTALKVFGGIAFMGGMAMRQLAQVKGARKKVGQ